MSLDTHYHFGSSLVDKEGGSTSPRAWYCGLTDSSTKYTPDSNLFPPGRREEPLGCSSKPIFKAFTQKLSTKVFGLPTSYDDFFYHSCVRHDLCYRHGNPTYGFDRAYCDKELKVNLSQNCNALSQNSRRGCNSLRKIISASMKPFGGRYFRSSTSKDNGLYCEYLRKSEQPGDFHGFWSAINLRKSELWNKIEKNSNKSITIGGEVFLLGDYNKLKRTLLNFFMGVSSDKEVIDAISLWTGSDRSQLKNLEQAHQDFIKWSKSVGIRESAP